MGRTIIGKMGKTMIAENAKLYHEKNVKDAIKLGEWDNGLPVWDFNYEERVLYRTKEGIYYIYGHEDQNRRFTFCEIFQNPEEKGNK